MTAFPLYFRNMMFEEVNPNLFDCLGEVALQNRPNNDQRCLYKTKTNLMCKSVLCMAPIIYC